MLATALFIAACSNQSDNAAPTKTAASPTASNATTAPAAPSAPTTTTTVVTDATQGSADQNSEFFDASLVHTMEITFDQGDYDAMIKAFQDNNDKTWMEANVTIDGVDYRQVGMRLKGNSSLFGVGGGVGGFEPGAPNGPTGGFAPIPEECLAMFDELPGGPGGGPVGQGGGPGGPGGDATADKPESLPWLIRLDKYIPDQAHQGLTDFVVRSSTNAGPLNEAVALDLLGTAGLATERAVAVRFSANGGELKLRLVIELPNDQWADDAFAKGGKLYKADSTGDYSYRGTDPADYATAWEQDGGSKDLTPLIDFLDFVNNSTDEDFAAQLPQRLDVQAFARYLAFEDLINNFDDIAGPGNNSYLYFDTATNLFTVVAWDHNLAFTSGFGPGGGNPGGGPPGGEPGLPFDPANLPQGCVLPGPPANGEPTAADAGNPFNRTNPLVNRFESNDQFAAMYDQAKATLTKDLFSSGAAQQSLETWTQVMTNAGLVKQTELTQLAEEIRSRVSGSLNYWPTPTTTSQFFRRINHTM